MKVTAVVLCAVIAGAAGEQVANCDTRTNKVGLDAPGNAFGSSLLQSAASTGQSGSIQRVEKFNEIIDIKEIIDMCQIRCLVSSWRCSSVDQRHCRDTTISNDLHWKHCLEKTKEDANSECYNGCEKMCAEVLKLSKSKL